MLVIGIAGGIASGKSLVAGRLQELGAVLLDADQAGHAVLRQQDVKQIISGRWGPHVLDGNGEVDRAKLAAMVFAPPPDGPPELLFLEQLTHPRIGQLLRRQAAQAARDAAPASVMDAPVMFKAGWNRLCDVIVFVDAPRELRLRRARQRGWSEAQFAAREAAQTPLEDKRRHADWIVDNSGTPENTARQVDEIWNALNLDSDL